MDYVKFYIGFTTLEDLLKDASDEIFYAATSKSQTVQYGIRRTDWLIRVAFIKNEKCFYWEFYTGCSNSMNGNPMGAEEEKSKERTFDFLRLFKKHLAVSFPKIKAVEAMVSFPNDLDILHGKTGLFSYDAKTNKFAENRGN